ncbi:MAG: DUF1003 domain-containing protein [Candidatus Pacebacteria bacterium]|nr:DUF1003 domain-containing protein [Candidatus Paceibacterota bacterium]
MSIHNPLSVSELREKRRPVRNPNIEHKEKLSLLEKIALSVTKTIGTMGFFLIVVAWTIGWLLWNLLAPVEMRFDPYPAFVLWLFISNMIQLMLLPLIMVGQNLQGKHAETRAEADFEVNVQAEEEIETILQHLENQNDLILKIINKLDGTKN